MKVSAVDLFCGAGGLTRGLEDAGVNVSVGIDVDPACKYPYEENNEADFRLTDIRPLAKNPERVAAQFERDADVRVLAGCAPCQPFSPLNHGGDSSQHDKYGMLGEFRDIVEYVRPDVVVMENVFEVRNHRPYEIFEETLERMGYSVNSDDDKNVYCPEYGIPQKRKRWVLIASRDGTIELGEPERRDESEYPTVRDAIGHLPALGNGEEDSSRKLHQARDLSELNEERIRNMRPGEDWTVWEEEGKEHLLLDCHKKASGRSYRAPYGRMSPDEPAPTMTTQFYNYGSGRFGHYDTDQDRALSLLEGAMIQTFPEDYEFVEDWDEASITHLGRMIGNAVPPLLGQRVGEAILSHYDTEAESSPEPSIAD
jgi:DNA (cytosine-5)-methyltransferase 1